jgi:hypothetical protein
MAKLGKIFFIIVVIGVVLYVVYLFGMMPSDNNNPVTLTTSFLDNITDDGVCESHFNPNTVSLCETFQTTLGTTSFTHSEVGSGDEVVVTITIGSNEDTFTFSFIEEENTSLNRFLNPTTYLIDIIE